ncbi:unnamed protein product [Ixodes pacificus]
MSSRRLSPRSSVNAGGALRYTRRLKRVTQMARAQRVVRIAISGRDARRGAHSFTPRSERRLPFRPVCWC